ncbi:MAG: glycosyl hydrolase, partial [Nitrososphaerota archaeon]
FSSRNGYDILEKLPLLYFEGEGFHKVRYDFWRAVTNRFIEAFTRPYSERCAALGLKMTGHYLAEDNFAMQTRAIGAAMPHYEYMQVPGVDHLGRNIDNPLTLKQCSSVAHQFGRTRVLSELFGCSGHSMTFEDQKWIADFHLALGITFFCPHLTLYTMKGETKRDFPPTFSYHQPYWQHFRYLNDYLARASYLCSRGKFYAYILLLHSISSAWATFSPTTEDRGSQAMKYSDALLKIQDDLLALHRDFDLGDELILSRHARVEGGELVVNESRYKIVMVPPSLTWSTNTVNLLTRFLDADGKVVFVGEPPSLIDGEPAETRWREILSHSNTISVSISRGSIAEALESMLPRSISVTDDEGNEIEDILIHHRVDGVYHIYFLANKSRVRKYDAVIKFAQMGEVTEWNMTDGSVSPISTIIQGDKIILKATFYPAGSRAFVVHTSKHPTPEGRRPQTELEEKIMELPDGWRFSRLHPNSMVLDTCQYSFGDGKWSEKTPIWKARRECWKASGLEKYAGIQPWVLITKHIKPSKSFEVKIRTTFKSEVVGKRVFLVIERAPMWRLSVNGKTVSTNVKEWQWDKQFGKIDISDYVKIGENSVEISCRYASDIPIEDMYLVGDFGVKKLSDTEYAITEEPEVLRNGDWVEQGYPFYTGTMRYKARFHMEKRPEAGERILIRFPDAKGTLFLISLNNREPALVAWQPLETDITDRVQMGENELTIDVVSSLRNTFGPLHSKFGDPYWVGPKTFVDEANWTDSYQLVPYGLIKGAQIVIRRETPKR